MAIVVLCVGAFLTLMGVAGFLYGLDALPSERGVAGVIASSVSAVGGVITIALGLVLKRMDDVMKLLPADLAAVPAVPDTAIARDEAESAEDGSAPIALPTIVPVERPVAREDVPPVKTGLPMAKETAVAAGAGIAGAAIGAGVAAATAGHDAVEKALDLDFAPSPPPLPKVAPLDIKPLRTEWPELAKADPARIELPKADLPEIKLPKIEPLRTDRPKFELPKFEMPKLDLPKLDLGKKAPMPAVEPEPHARRDHEVELPVEVLAPVDEPAPVANAPALATEAKRVDVMHDFERELDSLIPLEASKSAEAESTPDIVVGHAESDGTATKHDANPIEVTADIAPAESGPALAVHAEPAPESEVKAEKPAPETPEKPAPGAEIVGAYESGGAKYTMYSDGSVVAEAGGETLFFKSLEELRDFIDAGVKS